MRHILYEAKIYRRTLQKKSLAVASTQHLAIAYQLLFAAPLFHEVQIYTGLQRFIFVIKM